MNTLDIRIPAAIPVPAITYQFTRIGWVIVQEEVGYSYTGKSFNKVILTSDVLVFP